MRVAEIKRKTNETDISIKLDLDGKGRSLIESGLGFLDHMLTLFSKHSFIDLELSCLGDLNVDAHHSVEDIGISLGKVIKDALGNKEGIVRYGTSYVPMDEALAMVSLDISNRAYLVFNCELERALVGDVDSELFEEFFRAFCQNAGITLHINLMYGKNNHHIVEAIFKALAKALKEAITIDEKIDGVMSTKGII